MLSFPKASGSVRLTLEDATDGGTLRAGRSQARRVLFFVVLLGSLVLEAGSFSFGQPNLPRGGWPAFLTAPRLPQSPWAAGAPLSWCRRSPLAAPPRVLPVVLFSRGVTFDPRNVPWALHATAGGGKSASAKSEKQKKKLKDKEEAEKEGASKHDVKWDKAFDELRVIAAANGGKAHVTQRDPERPGLGTWCVHQRNMERRGDLRPDRKARLVEIGFPFDPLEDSWDESLEELRVVAAGNGGVAHITRSDLERPELGRWCNEQRIFGRKGELRADRKARLLEIGFVFSLQGEAWEKSLEELRLVAESNGGTAHVLRNDPERLELGRWCATQRTLEERGDLRADRKARLLEIGFVFDLR